MTRKPKAGEQQHFSITLDGALMLALDDMAEQMSRERPGLTLTRTDVVRVALHEWLADRKKEHKR